MGLEQSYTVLMGNGKFIGLLCQKQQKLAYVVDVREAAKDAVGVKKELLSVLHFAHVVDNVVAVEQCTHQDSALIYCWKIIMSFSEDLRHGNKINLAYKFKHKLVLFFQHALIFTEKNQRWFNSSKCSFSHSLSVYQISCLYIVKEHNCYT